MRFSAVLRILGVLDRLPAKKNYTIRYANVLCVCAYNVSGVQNKTWIAI